MTRSVRRLAVLLVLLFIALLVNITVVQVWLAGSYRAKTGNQRVLLKEYSRERGPILVGAAPVARSVATNDTLRYLRQYSAGPLYAPATGFYSLVYGATGIEKAENDVLSGSDDRFFVDRLTQLFANRQPQGGAVTLTLDAATQQAAFEGLRGKKGAVAAIDPTTGAILAIAQSPSFDPGKLSSHDPAEIRAYYAALNKDPDKPLLNRPLVSLNPPGSTFKLVVAAAALESGRFTADSVLPGPAEYQLPGSTRTLRNWTGADCGPQGQVTLREALAVSCNTAFAWLGNQLGAGALQNQSAKFGFGTGFQVPMNAATSRFPTDPDPAQVAQSSIGQFDVRATALQMALVGAAAGNNGVTMYPYLVQAIRGPDLALLETASPERFDQAMSPENAASLIAMMVGVVDNGTGSNAQIPGVQVAGKTGTAQTGNNRPSVAWFVAVAPATQPSVAVAVVIEDAGDQAEVSGNRLAAPIAKAVIQAALSRPGLQP